MNLKQTIDIEMGDVDILINNAGLLPRVSLMEGTEKDITKIIDVNFKAHFWVSDLVNLLLNYIYKDVT
jgi:all-trans-retinol dehydrogenase (NAD+)